MKKVFIVVRITPNPDYNAGAEVACLAVFPKKKAAQEWLTANQAKYEKDLEYCDFEIQTANMIEGES